MTLGCTFEGCTVGETGRCALEQDPLTCSKREVSILSLRSADDSEDAIEGLGQIGSPILTAPERESSFTPSTTLGIEAIRDMMAWRYIKIVGILGDPESGKTAALVSLYLLISNAKLSGWSFADSRSLMGFEEIARGARQWNSGNPPEQMTAHTQMADERRPGFLHLRLRRDVDGRCVDIALPDIPGEWTKNLVRTSQTAQFEFLKSAETIWLVVDGRQLNDKTQRQGAITRLGQLARRLQTFLGSETLPRLLLVLTNHDAGAVPLDVIERVNTEMAKYQLSVQVMPIASFSETEGVKAGTGLPELMSATINGPSVRSEIWPSSHTSSDRNYLKFRRH